VTGGRAGRLSVVDDHRLLLLWVVVVGALGVLMALAARAGSPLDDPDPARQRPGFLDAVGRPTPAPTVAPGVPSPGRRAVVFFVRPQLAAPLCRAIAADPSLRRRADLAVVSSGPAPTCPGAGSVPDGGGGVASAFGMRRPRDGGPPVGYAVVDRAGRVRYRTLDPSVVHGLREVETMVKATP
jgi:hypothetical protein